MRSYTTYALLFLIYGMAHLNLQARHPFRVPDPRTAQVTVSLEGYDPYTMHSHRLRIHPIFSFHSRDLQEYLIPLGPIHYRNDQSQSITGTELGAIVERVVAEVVRKKKRIKRAKATQDCIVIRDKNFNYKSLHGLIILKCKQYPFFVKLFMENPNSFFDFRSTGIEPTFFFYMGGGANRHLTGLTRIPNRNLIQQTVDLFPRWKNHIEMPRKWFWIPQDQHDLHIVGKNIGGYDEISTQIPSVYAVIEDEINLKQEAVTLSKKKKRKMIIDLCNDMHIYIDPHPKNYEFIVDPKTKQFKIAIIDTEHFPTMSGIQTVIRFKSHKGWYTYLAQNFINRMFFLTKKDLVALQNSPSSVSLDIPII